MKIAGPGQKDRRTKAWRCNTPTRKKSESLAKRFVASRVTSGVTRFVHRFTYVYVGILAEAGII